MQIVKFYFEGTKTAWKESFQKNVLPKEDKVISF